MSLLGRFFPAAKRATPASDGTARLAEALALHQRGDTIAALRIWAPLAEAGERRAAEAARLASQAESIS